MAPHYNHLVKTVDRDFLVQAIRRYGLAPVANHIGMNPITVASVALGAARPGTDLKVASLIQERPLTALERGA